MNELQQEQSNSNQIEEIDLVEQQDSTIESDDDNSDESQVEERDEEECIGVEAFPGTKQIKYGGFIFNHHMPLRSKNNPGDVFRCNKAKTHHKCNCEIRLFKKNNKYLLKNRHNHASDRLLRTTRKLIDLSQARQERLKSYLFDHQKSSKKEVCRVLNVNVDADDNESYITPEQVNEAKKKWIYTSKVESWDEIRFRSELSTTATGNPFLRYLILAPKLCVIYCADWQLKLLDTSTSLDQLFIDGTFNVCPRGIQQLITISIKKHAHSGAIPLIWALMEGKEENDYFRMLREVMDLCPNLASAGHEIYLTVDFELAMHKAIARVYKKPVIVGCFFHFKQCVHRWVRKNAQHSFRTMMSDSNNIQTLSTALTAMAKAESEEVYHNEKNNFIAHYGSLENTENFISYMKKMWIGDSAIYHCSKWVKCFVPRIDVDRTNNLAEEYHKDVNRRFMNKPDIKRTINILKEMEVEFHTTFVRNGETRAQCRTQQSAIGTKRTIKAIQMPNDPKRRRTNDPQTSTSNQLSIQKDGGQQSADSQNVVNPATSNLLTNPNPTPMLLQTPPTSLPTSLAPFPLWGPIPQWTNSPMAHAEVPNGPPSHLFPFLSLQNMYYKYETNINTKK